MDGKNLNDIMKLDPSLEKGKFSKVYERKCPVMMKITEQTILDRVNQQVEQEENLHFKILVKGRSQITPRNMPQSFEGSPHGDDKIMTPEKSSTSFVQPFPESKLKLDADQNPEIIRIEVMSDNDYFF